MTAAGVNGPATISTEGGSLAVNGLTGALQADSAGGPVVLRDLGSQPPGISTGGGSGQVAFSWRPSW